MSTTNPRIPPLPGEEWTEDAREVFGYWEGPEARKNGSIFNTMMTLANHPRLAIASLDFGRYLLTKSSLTVRQREITILRVAWLYDSHYQWAHHVRSARRIGMTDVEFAALEDDPDYYAWSPEEGAMIRAIDQLCDAGRIDDPTWSILAAGMNRHQLMDFVYSVGFFAMNAWAFGAMGVQIEPGIEPSWK